MDAILEQAREVKQALVTFVLEAEGELAEAMESYVAERLAQSQRQDRSQNDLLVDAFLIEGEVQEQAPLDLFIATQPDLSSSDRDLLKRWHQSFTGLFEVIEILDDGFELMNWFSAKHYLVKPNHELTLKEMGRFKQGEILLTRIAPVTDTQWMFSGPCTPMGCLGKPKLAVAIGNFRKSYPNSLYADAPDLLEEAWQSVAIYHQEFVDFFGSDRITMSGYHLNQKIGEFQELMTQKRLAEAGIDDTQSLAEAVANSDVDEEDIAAAAAATGVEAKVVSNFLKNPQASKMVMPKVELPPDLKKAEQVTVFAHPRWGQMFLPTYTQVEAVLTAEDGQSGAGAESIIRQFLKNPDTNAYVWQQLAAAYPTQLETALQTALNRPDFNLEQDLESLLKEFGKPWEPILPEIASVPLHLHDLFQEALAEVSKTKKKTKKKSTKGFLQR